jgi:GNAT superfamily N-acetyltransferase
MFAKFARKLQKGEKMGNVTVVTFEPRFLSAFVELNREWIEKYFILETMDIVQLESPYESILNRGGEIFFVLESDIPVGTVSLIPHGQSCYELAKMAVSSKARGKGFGDLLMKAAIAWAKKKGAKKLTLLSNTILKPAITLYQKYGFETVRLGRHPDYARCNIEMELKIQSGCGIGQI